MRGWNTAGGRFRPCSRLLLSLFLSFGVQENGYQRKKEVRYPQRYRCRHCTGIYEHLGEPLEKYVREGQGYAYAQVPAGSSPPLPRRKADAHYGKDYGGEGHGETVVQLDLGKHHVGIPPHVLGGYQLIEVLYLKRLHRLVVAVEVRNGQLYDRVFLGTAGDVVLQPGSIVADEPVAQAPAFLGAVPDSGIGLQLALELVFSFPH